MTDPVPSPSEPSTGAPLAHPAFSHPTAVEAICEVHFRLPEGRSWVPRWYGDLFQRIQAEFPRMEPEQIVAVGATLSPRGLEHRVVPPILRMRYLHRERAHQVQLAPGVFTVNELSPYPGWGRFGEDLKAGWSHLLAVLGEATVHRVGLRYINHLPKAGTDELLSAWLAESEHYPRKILGCSSHFLSRFEHNPLPGLRLVVTVADGTDGEGRPVFVLDLDAIVEADLQSGWDCLYPEVDRLHDRIWAAFDSTLTPRYLTRLREGRA
ncbi:MAG: TIGR04255 family protein [Planctomycetes bacterium]|nr:TIGR04255 family protein [Planctomycetota bacterium]